MDQAPLVVGDNGAEGRSQPSVRNHAVQPASFDQRGNDGSVLGADIVTGKERVRPVQSNRADGPLDSIAVELDAPIGQEQFEPSPVFGDVAQCCPERRF